MQDGCGRTIDYLRLSVTDRCNYRCQYCMPETGVEKRAHGDILTLEELAEEGLIRADPDSGFEEFPAGLLLTVEDSIEADGRHTFSLQKYRSSLGAYCFYDCTARQEGDGWSYAVGAEMIS